MRLLKLALNLMTLTFVAIVSMTVAVGLSAPSAVFAQESQEATLAASSVKALNRARTQEFLTCAPKRALQGLMAVVESMPLLSLAALDNANLSFLGETSKSLASNQYVHCGDGEWKSVESLSETPKNCSALQSGGFAVTRLFLGGLVPAGAIVIKRISQNLVVMALDLSTKSPYGDWNSLSPDDKGTIANYYFSTNQLQQLLTQNPHSQCMKAKAKVKELEAALEAATASPALK